MSARVLPVLIVLLLVGIAEGQLRSKQLVQEVGLDQHLGTQLPLDAMLRDETGRSVALGEFCGEKPVILNFVYFRCPMLCTQVLNGLLRSSQAMELALGKDYQIVSISIDPRETPAMAAAKKKSYVASYRRPGAEQGWHFLTADEATIEQLTQAAGFRYRYDDASDQYAHASGIMLVTPQGRISRYYYGIDFNPSDLRLGLVESSENRLGTVVDQVLLLCYHYDPATGKYGLAIARLIRVAGVSTMLVLGVFLFRMYRLERRRSAEATP
jgi:protein SCO1/2